MEQPQFNVYNATRRRLAGAVAGSLLLHAILIGVAGRFQPAPVSDEDEDTFTVTIETSRTPRHAPTTPQKAATHRNLPPRRLQAPPRIVKTQPNRQNSTPRDRQMPSHNANSLSSAPDIRPHDVGTSTAKVTRRSAEPEISLPGSDANAPRRGRMARNHKSDAMQLSLDSGASNFRQSSAGSLPGSLPFSPGTAASGGRERGDEPTGDSSTGNWDGSRTGRTIASLPGGSGAARAGSSGVPEENAAETGDENRSNDAPRGSQNRRRRSRDVTERESALELPPPAPTPRPSPTPRPTPTATAASKPVEVREKPDAPASEVFRRARIRSQPQPQYPSSARAANQQGDTTLRLSISAEGDVTAAEVVGSSGSDALDQAASRGARRWKYDPARQGDAAVASSLKVVVHWTLKD